MPDLTFRQMTKQAFQRLSKINERLTDTCEKEKKSELYKDMICLIKEIADHVIPKENEVWKGMDDIMGGKVLTLPSDLIREGREEGLTERLITGRNQTIFIYVHKGRISLEEGAQDAGMSISDFKKAMTDAGFNIPTND